MNTNRKKKYGVVSPMKSILSSTLIITILLSFIIQLGVVVHNVYATSTDSVNIIESDTESLKTEENNEPKYIYQNGDINISANDKDEYIKKLEESLDKSNDTINDITTKYDSKVNEYKTLTKMDIDLYNEYSYAIEYPKSDVTLDDIKMITRIAKEYDLNPHLWLSKVELESGYRSYAKSSSSSASGWGQVIKGTAKWVYENKLKLGTYNHSTMGTNKEINTRISMYYLSSLIKENGVYNGLIRYNGGELGAKYANVIAGKLHNNTGMDFKQVNHF